MAKLFLHPGSVADQELLDGSVQSGWLDGIRLESVTWRQPLEISKQPDPYPVETFHDGPDQVVVDMMKGCGTPNYKGNVVKRLADKGLRIAAGSGWLLNWLLLDCGCREIRAHRILCCWQGEISPCGRL